MSRTKFTPPGGQTETKEARAARRALERELARVKRERDRIEAQREKMRVDAGDQKVVVKILVKALASAKRTIEEFELEQEQRESREMEAERAARAARKRA
jgi:hypothetical protein